jgi:hypothetical protein
MDSSIPSQAATVKIRRMQGTGQACLSCLCGFKPCMQLHAKGRRRHGFTTVWQIFIDFLVFLLIIV